MAIVGVLKLPVNGFQYFVVTGGPYRSRPTTMRGVKMAVEIPLSCDIDIPTEDYQTPNVEVLATGVATAVGMMLAGDPLYVGCMGGKGRTGLFLAVLAKAFGVKQPVEYVRKHYYRHAVETEEQYQFVEDFVIDPGITQALTRLRRWSWLRFWKTNLTRMPGRHSVAVPQKAESPSKR